jgi:hypothetical protein
MRVRVWRRITIKGAEKENKGYASFAPVGRKTVPDKVLRIQCGENSEAKTHR